MFKEKFDNIDDLLKAVKEDGMNLRLASVWLEVDKKLALVAVKNNPYAMQFVPDELQEDEELLSYVTKDDDYYFSIVNQCTGLKYSIPLLVDTDPDYYNMYVYYMKLKERSPNSFENAINWN